MASPPHCGVGLWCEDRCVGTAIAALRRTGVRTRIISAQTNSAASQATGPRYSTIAQAAGSGIEAARLLNGSHRAGKSVGWGARIRTWEWRNQNPLPYHLATPHQPAGTIYWLACRAAMTPDQSPTGPPPPPPPSRAAPPARARPAAVAARAQSLHLFTCGAIGFGRIHVAAERGARR